MNNSSTFVCLWTTSWSPFTDAITYLTYTATPPLFFILGMIGHIVALLAFSKQGKSDAAYAYQVFVTVIKTFEIFFFDLFILFFMHFADQDWSAQKGDQGWAWFKNQKVLMWSTAHLATLLQSASITGPILATAAMTADRVVGLWKPIFYKTMNKKKHQAVAYLLCFILTLAVSAEASFRWQAAEAAEGSGYKVTATSCGSNFCAMMSQMRNFVRFAAEFVLISSSVAMIFLYKNHLNKISSMTSKNDAREARAKSSQKMIFVLALFHSVSTVVPTFLLTAYSTANYLLADFAKCDGRLLAVSIDFIIQLVNAIDFYLLYLVNKQFRSIVNKLIKPNQT